jgi:hypothetical protein
VQYRKYDGAGPENNKEKNGVNSKESSIVATGLVQKKENYCLAIMYLCSSLLPMAFLFCMAISKNRLNDLLLQIKQNPELISKMCLFNFDVTDKYCSKH